MLFRLLLIFPLLMSAFHRVPDPPEKTVQYSINRTLFPVADAIKPNVDFWISIFSAYSREQVVLHDTENLNIIYAVLDFRGQRLTSREQELHIESAKDYYAQILLTVAGCQRSADFKKLTREEKKVVGLFRGRFSAEMFQTASEHIRDQSGLREEFSAGIARSGQYLAQMKAIFKTYALPEELIYLPHVESSFNYRAYSFANAAGIWQFTKGTGRQFLKINRSLDERVDPILSTEAAAKLLQQNFKKLHTWPLAITAYNHGQAGMVRAVDQVGTRELGEIYQRYQSPSFRFASRNFYAEFVAAVHVRMNYQQYFGKIVFEDPLDFQYYELAAATRTRGLTSKLDLSFETLRTYNPAIRKRALRVNYRFLKGYQLRIPADDALNLPESASTAMFPVHPASAAIVYGPKQNVPVPQPSSAEYYQFLTPDNGRICVQPGETLGHYSDWLNILTRELRTANGLKAGASLTVGRNIKLLFRNVTSDDFSQKRAAFHEAIEADYFKQYSVIATNIHPIRSGDNIWRLCKKRYGVPLWLVLRFNPHLEVTRIKAGDKIMMPTVQKIAYSRSAADGDISHQK